MALKTKLQQMNSSPSLGQTLEQTSQDLYNTFWGSDKPDQPLTQATNAIGNVLGTIGKGAGVLTDAINNYIPFEHKGPKQVLAADTDNHITINSPWKVYDDQTNSQDEQQAIGNNNQSPVPDSLYQVQQQTQDIFKKQGIHPAVAYGIANAEGGRIGKNNLWNINATDSNPNGAYNYQNIQDAAASAAATMKTLLNKSGYKGSDAAGQLNAIEKAGYAGDPSDWKQRSLKSHGAGKYFDHWSDFVRATPSWKKWGGN